MIVTTTTDRPLVRMTLRRMRRRELLLVAYRAIELLPEGCLPDLLADLTKLPRLDTAVPRYPPLLEDVQIFVTASLGGKYYESLDVNWKNCSQWSAGTDGFSVEFDRLITRCLALADQDPGPVLEAFDRLFDLLREIDADPDRIVFFADEAGSWQIPVDWRAVLPVYFTCLGSDLPPQNFAQAVDRAIQDFCHHDRPHLILAANRVATDAQRVELDLLTPSP
jgi:hypothetical protein